MLIGFALLLAAQITILDPCDIRQSFLLDPKFDFLRRRTAIDSHQCSLLQAGRILPIIRLLFLRFARHLRVQAFGGKREKVGVEGSLGKRISLSQKQVTTTAKVQNLSRISKLLAKLASEESPVAALFHRTAGAEPPKREMGRLEHTSAVFKAPWGAFPKTLPRVITQSRR